MATPAILANNAEVKLAGTSIKGRSNQVKLTINQPKHDGTVFGDTWQEIIAGLPQGTITVNSFQDSAQALTAVLWPMVAPATFSTFEIDPTGTAAGADKFTGNCFLDKFDTDSKPNAPAVLNSSFTTTGTVTRAAN